MTYLLTQKANSYLLPEGMTWALEVSLARLQTTYVDFYCIHAVSSLDEFDDSLKRRVLQMKKKGTIRHFGITTHRNMQTCMLQAARSGWIDGVLMSYNYRLMYLPSMKRAVVACKNAGVALVAMKNQAAALDRLVGAHLDRLVTCLSPSSIGETRHTRHGSKPYGNMMPLTAFAPTCRICRS